MSDTDDVRKAQALLLRWLQQKSPWVKGKEREFQVVQETLGKVATEWDDRDRHMRQKEQ